MVMSKVIFWGAGTYGRDFLKECKKASNIYNDEIIAFVDSNVDKWGTYIEGIKIISPVQVMKENFNYIVITSIYINQIKEQLINLGINTKNIITSDGYSHICYTKYQYYQRYGYVCNESKMAMISPIVVYTCITGNYDNLQEPLLVDNNIEYVCFTNNRAIKSKKWNIEYVSDNQLDDMYLAKKYKFFPNEFFREYELSVWVDGKFLIKNNFCSYISKYKKNMPMICFPHFERNCIYEEAAECIKCRKGDRVKILQQCSDYFRDSYPINNGLYEMGCIVREHNNPLVIKLMQEWWQQIQKYSYRDQISFPYVCWKNNFRPDICDLPIGSNPWLEVKKHNS